MPKQKYCSGMDTADMMSHLWPTHLTLFLSSQGPTIVSYVETEKTWLFTHWKIWHCLALSVLFVCSS